MADKNIVALPEGISVGNKPEGIEDAGINGKWLDVINTLKVIDSTKCVQIDITAKSKNQIQSIKSSIKHCAKNVKFNHRIRYAVKSDVLYVWVNK